MSQKNSEGNGPSGNPAYQRQHPGLECPQLEPFKEAFSRHAAGVAVITAMLDGRPYGFTATSLASLSATPPRFTFNMATTSSSWPAVSQAEHVGVHVLAEGDRETADRFARSKDRFLKGTWSEGPFGVPLVGGTHAWLVGRVLDRHVYGENAVVVCEVVDGGHIEMANPLVYHNRRYSIPQLL